MHIADCKLGCQQRLFYIPGTSKYFIHYLIKQAKKQQMSVIASTALELTLRSK
jgi:hypothetical protein